MNSQADNIFDVTGAGGNPYGLVPAVSMNDAPRHESGNALAANAEARAVAEVKAQVLMARQFPRNPAASVDNILRECERPTLADKATYAYPRGNETVSGPSIRLAEMMARNWGNCNFGLEVLERKSNGRVGGYSILRAFAWDLETNTYASRQFEVRHWRQTKTGGYALTEDRDIYELEANMGARRMRACILQILPGDVTQAAVDKCRMVISDGLIAAMNDPKRRKVTIDSIVKVFDKVGVTLSDLETHLKALSRDWNADHAIKLKDLRNGIEDGALSLKDVFPHLSAGGGDEKITKEQATELLRLIAATGEQGAISDALKKLGIAKVADTPAKRYDEIKALIESRLPARDEPDTAPPPADVDGVLQERIEG